MEECDEIRRWSAAHSRLVTIYWTEQITPTEHLIRARCSHLSPLGAGMEEFAVCSAVLHTGRGRASLSFHTSVVFSASVCLHIFLFLSVFAMRQVSAVNLWGNLDHMLCNKKQQIRNRLMWWPLPGAHTNKKHHILCYWLCIKHIDGSVGVTGESGGPNAVLKAFPATKEKKI